MIRDDDPARLARLYGMRRQMRPLDQKSRMARRVTAKAPGMLASRPGFGIYDRLGWRIATVAQAETRGILVAAWQRAVVSSPAAKESLHGHDRPVPIVAIIQVQRNIADSARIGQPASGLKSTANFRYETALARFSDCCCISILSKSARKLPAPNPLSPLR